MANTIDDKLVDRIYAMALSALRKRTSVLRYVTRKDDEVNTPGFKGQNVIIPLPAAMADATDVAPSNVPPAPSDIAPSYAEVNLNNWKKTNFALTDLEVSRLQASTMSNQFSAAIDALARTVIKSVWNTCYKGIYNFAGTAGTTPFASSTVQAQDAMFLLNEMGAPVEDRAMILGYKAHANAIGLPAFQNYSNANNSEALREGYIGRALGMDWDQDGYLPTFTGGTLTNGTGKAALINKANVAIGDTSVPMDSGTLTGTLVVGDLFTVAGDTQQYVVTANATASGNAITVSFFPPAKVAWADNSAVTFVASHAVAGVALQRQAIAFASKPIDDVQFLGGSMIRQVPDPQSGLVLCLEISRQYKQTMAEFSLLWGSTLARPECAVRILG